ncbi:MAG TPA: dihydropteroate synthase [Candidatus Omnitrophota bacterium]|nr:dihydropteroate synthase [Candidatus Omnitrophota bacterium]
MIRVIAIPSREEAERELKKIGAEAAGVAIMADKSVFRTLKIDNVRTIAANIIKQEMLSYGGEAATGYGSLDLSARATDILIAGTLKQFKLLCAKLKRHQFGLPELAKEVETALKNHESPPPPITVNGRKFVFGKRTYLMGILNVTPDSFSDGGKFLSPDHALAQAEKMIGDGADIIDIGGESTRPGAEFVPAAEETERVVPVIKALSKKKVPVSIDTRKAAVAEAAVRAGAGMINDVSGLRHDRKMAEVAARHKVPVAVMHSSGAPKVMQKRTGYRDLMADITAYLDKSVKIAENTGVPRSRVIIDPGFGFGKTPEQNLEILRRINELKSLGNPVLIGTSRKSTIGHVLGLPPDRRIEGTSSTMAIAISGGVDIIRVHDVNEMKKIAVMTDAIVRRSSNGKKES